MSQLHEEISRHSRTRLRHEVLLRLAGVRGARRTLCVIDWRRNRVNKEQLA
jgi:hypothetical protein